MRNQLDLDDKLEILQHIEKCPNCWYQLYLLRLSVVVDALPVEVGPAAA